MGCIVYIYRLTLPGRGRPLRPVVQCGREWSEQNPAPKGDTLYMHMYTAHP